LQQKSISVPNNTMSCAVYVKRTIPLFLLIAAVTMLVAGCVMEARWRFDKTDFNEHNIPTTCTVLNATYAKAWDSLGKARTGCTYTTYNVSVAAFNGLIVTTYSNYFPKECDGVRLIPVGTTVTCYIRYAAVNSSGVGQTVRLAGTKMPRNVNGPVLIAIGGFVFLVGIVLFLNVFGAIEFVKHGYDNEPTAHAAPPVASTGTA